ncbi:AP-3 complex subunit delta isoform X2 [Magnolia sinica]|nr:AP-3 complex subunit delta isoform X2 [Magnolia sinica]
MISSSSSSPSSIIDCLFQRSLDDLIKSLRSQLVPESKLISKALDEIRHELKSTDLATKSVALQKLTFLSSIHSVDPTFASFPTIELLSSPRFSHKKTAYLAASLSFHPGTDVLLLIPNQLRKDLASPNPFESSLALEFLSVAATPDLARELTPDVFALLATSKPALRKKAIAVIWRFFNTYPDSVRVAFKRLVENLDGSDPSTVSAAIGVFCEMAAKDPKSYLPLAPEFYRVLVDSKNNWILIKVVKIFGKLAPLEPRLAKRVVDPICEHMRRTGAKSLIFECVRMVVSSLSDFELAVKLAVEKIREFLVDEDPNLRYLGLNALSILKSTHLWAVIENKEVIIKSLSDADPNIRLESLHLVLAMVTERNVAEISRILLNYALKSDPEFCNEILRSILLTCSRNVYELIADFDWYVSILGEMSRHPHCGLGEEIERQLVDIGLRVKDVRPELVRVARDLLIDPALLGNPSLYRILSAAAWVSGEYVEFSKNPFELMEALLQPRTNLLPPLVRAVYIQSAFKVLVFCLHSYLMQTEAIPSSPSVESLPRISGSVSEIQCLEEDSNAMLSNRSTEDVAIENEASLSVSLDKTPFTYESVTYLLNLIKMGVDPVSDEVEIQERARNVLALINVLDENPGSLNQKGGSFENQELKTSEIVRLLYDTFSEKLGPVSANAQERVLVPDGLILNENLAELESISANDIPQLSVFSTVGHRQKEMESEPSTESTSLLAEHRKRHGLYYLPAEKNETESNDYPPANNDTKLLVNVIDAADDLVKLTEESLVPKKPNRVKPRPVVVKLDEGDEAPFSSTKPVKDLKDDLLSGAVRDILCGEEGKSRSSHAEKSSRRRGKEISLNGDSVTLSKENSGDTEKPRNGSPSSRTSRHRNRGKDKHTSHHENGGKEENSQKSSQKSSRHHGRHKTRHRADGSLSRMIDIFSFARAVEVLGVTQF